MRTISLLIPVLALALVLAGCAASRAFSQGKTAAGAGEWDVAVDHYRRALAEDPGNTEYRLALQRAMASASLAHIERARIAELRGQLEQAAAEYRRANEFDPSNRQLEAKVADLEKKIRAAAEAAQAPSAMAQMQASARQTAAGPVLFRLNETLPVLSFGNASPREILAAIGKMAGINVNFERDYQDPRPYSFEMEGVTLEQALQAVTSANALFYKVQNPRSILIINDTQQKRTAYDEQVIKILRLSHADATEVTAMVQQVVRITGAAAQLQFTVAANKTQNSITLRAPLNVAQIIERVVESLDTPRAEVVVEVEILEVRKSRLKEYGLDLGNYTIGAVYSPTVDQSGADALRSPVFNLNNLSNGVNRGDFYLAVPAAAVRFLESDTQTKLLAKTQLRGAEGQKLVLNLGEEVPVPNTVFTPLAQGGANVSPLSSFNYRTVGIVLEATPRVTYEDEVMLDLLVENSARGQDANIGGSNLPTFATRRVTGQMRLRDGQPHLLAGLLQENERTSLTGFPTLLRLPIIKQLFSSNASTVEQTDIIFLLTPRVVRSHELTQADVDALFIGTAQNLGIGGAPPLIALPEAPPAAAPPAPGAPPGALAPAPGAPGAPTAPAPTLPAGQTPVPAAPPGTPPGANLAPPSTTPQAAVPALPPRSPTGPTTSLAAPAAAATGAAIAGAQIVTTPSATEFRVGSTTPYAVPVNVANATRLSSVSLTLTYNQAAVRPIATQEGKFLSSAGGAVAFTSDIATPGRVDIVIMRTGDTTGATGTGLLASVLFQAVAPGPANFVVTGTATLPNGAPLPLQFAPVQPVTVR